MMGEIEVKNFDNFDEKFNFTKEKINEFVSQYDIIVPQKQFAGQMHWQYGYTCNQDIKDLDFCTDYIIKKYPEMKNAVKKYLRSNKGYFCNQFIMKKDIFFKYNEWLFDILEAQERFNPHTDADVQTYRVSGYLAERLFGIYITYLTENSNIKLKEVPRIVIKNPNIKNYFISK